VEVLDLLGHRVRTLAHDREFRAGHQILEWDGLDEEHSPARRVYFIRAQVGGHAEGKRLVLLE
jgi:hypothetical protein